MVFVRSIHQNDVWFAISHVFDSLKVANFVLEFTKPKSFFLIGVEELCLPRGTAIYSQFLLHNTIIIFLRNLRAL